jgi:hypothetical protein
MSGLPFTVDNPATELRDLSDRYSFQTTTR